MAKPINGYEGRYTIDENGMVYSVYQGRNIAVTKHKKGYLKVTLYNPRKTYLLHRLIGQHFLDGDGTQINHIDGNKENNSISNLEWVTPSKNIQHSLKIGLRRYKVSQENVETMKSLRLTGKSYKKIGKIFSVSDHTAWDLINDKYSISYGKT